MNRKELILKKILVCLKEIKKQQERAEAKRILKEKILENGGSPLVNFYFPSKEK